MESMDEMTERVLYRDPNTLYKSATIAGSVEKISFVDDYIIVSSAIDGGKTIEHNLDTVILLDAVGRFVSMAPIKGGIGIVRVSGKDIGRDNAASTVKMYAMSALHNFAYPIGVSPSLKDQYSIHARKWLPADSVDVPSIKDKLSSLIRESVKLNYISTSIHSEIKTGNSYQTISLGEGSTTSGRPDRMSYLSRINFRDKSVLDIGANTGEMSRSVRALGARLVDGYEYDPYFVEIGRAVNALVGTTRVSLFQGDCTRAALYQDFHYDIVLALNVWVYISGVMPIIRDIAPIVVFETHTLDHGMNFYYKHLSRWFSAAACIGLTDVGEDPHKSRAFIILANNNEIIYSRIQQEFVAVKPYFKNSFLERVGILTQQEALGLAAKYYEERSEANWGSEKHCAFGSEGYFQALLAGFHQFGLEGEKVSDENFYLRFFARGVTEGVIDNRMKNIVEQTKWLKRKVANKFEDMQNIILGFPQRVPPIQLVQQAGGKLQFTTSKGETIGCSEIDGHHRFFMAQVMGVERIHCQIVRR